MYGEEILFWELDTLGTRVSRGIVENFFLMLAMNAVTITMRSIVKGLKAMIVKGLF